MRIYLSGPMTGIEDHNLPEFNRVAARLRDLGYIVYNPAENFGGDCSLPRHEYMRVDLTHLLQAQAVHMLLGWENSAGAICERMVGFELNLPFTYEGGVDHYDARNWVV